MRQVRALKKLKKQLLPASRREVAHINKMKENK